jgi:uncharacterized membrane protein (UPF0127 family)
MRTIRRLAVTAVAALALATGCKSDGQRAGSTSAPPAAASATIDTGARKVTFRLELALTPQEQERGLMFRKSLDADAGMLFVSKFEGPHVFWMKNTLIPLDMIFIDDSGRIVGIVERAEPLTLVNRDVGVPSRYVLEVNGGWAEAHGVGAGDLVRFENVPRF